jgi:hypothetical protein
MKKGQYYRLLLSTTSNPTKVIAAAKDMSLHLSASTEESSTKDTTGDALEYEITAQSYDISGSALILTDDDALGGSTAVTLNDFLGFLGDNLLYWKICLMNGDNQRTIASTVFSGTAKLTSLQASGQAKQNATYSYTLTGYDAVATGTVQSSST